MPFSKIPMPSKCIYWTAYSFAIKFEYFPIKFPWTPHQPSILLFRNNQSRNVKTLFPKSTYTQGAFTGKLTVFMLFESVPLQLSWAASIAQLTVFVILNVKLSLKFSKKTPARSPSNFSIFSFPRVTSISIREWTTHFHHMALSYPN